MTTKFKRSGIIILMGICTIHGIIHTLFYKLDICKRPNQNYDSVTLTHQRSYGEYYQTDIPNLLTT